MPVGLKWSFIDIRDTIGKETAPTVDELTVRTVDLEKDFGLKNLTAVGMYDMLSKLDEATLIKYQAARLGFDTSNETDIATSAQLNKFMFEGKAFKC